MTAKHQSFSEISVLYPEAKIVHWLVSQEIATMNHVTVGTGAQISL